MPRSTSDFSLIARPSWLPKLKTVSTSGGYIEIKSKSSRTTKFFGILITTLIWDGLTGVACYFAYESWRKGRTEGCLVAVLCIFVPIGLLMLYSVIHQFLVLFNPQPSVRLSALESLPGGTIDVHWTMKGRSSAIKNLRFVLEGQEEATYRQGTDTRTDVHVFARVKVHETQQGPEIAQGHIRIRIPDDAVHSFNSGNNKIQWLLKMHGQISGWPDLAEDYEIIVRPYAISEIRR